MELMAILLILFCLWLLIGPIVALIRAKEAQNETKEVNEQLKLMAGRMRRLEIELHELKRGGGKPPAPSDIKDLAEEFREEEKWKTGLPAKRSSPPQPSAEQVPPPRLEPRPVEGALGKTQVPGAGSETAMPVPASAGNTPPVPPPLPPGQKSGRWDEEWEQPEPAYKKAGSVEKTEQVPARAAGEAFSLEKFLGVKLFAWLGGVAMFFGVVFFVRYAFENNLISPAGRVALGFVTGAGLLGGGLFTHRLPRYRVLAQAFCATGILILYGVSFAAHAVYHFPAFGTIPTFVLMAAITFSAFLIAVRLEALVVAVLGMLGGFMTPVLLSTGQDQVLGLFGYIALLDIGLLAVSRHHRWKFLVPFAAVGTAVMQIGWFVKFFEAGDYDDGTKTLVPMGMLLGFVALFLVGGWIKRKRPDVHSTGATVLLAGTALLFAFVMLGYGEVSERYFLLHGFSLLVQLAVTAAIFRRRKLEPVQMIAAGAAFLHVACWGIQYLEAGKLAHTLFVFGYVALLDAGLLALSRYKRWNSLVPLAAVGTALLQAGWYPRFFGAGGFAEGGRTLVPMGILLGFIGLFLAGGWIRRKRPDLYTAGGALLMASTAMAFAFATLRHPQVSERYFLLHGFSLLVQLTVLVTVFTRRKLEPAQLIVAGLAFLHLALWSHKYLGEGNLVPVLFLYLVFGALHAGAPLLSARLGLQRDEEEVEQWPIRQVAPWFLPLVLLMMVIPLTQMATAPVALWVAVLAADLLVIGLAVLTGGLVPMVAGLLLTLLLTGIWLMRMPSTGEFLMPFLGTVLGFSTLFAWVGKRFSKDTPEWKDLKTPDQYAAYLLPVFSGVLPFVLIVMATQMLRIPNPLPVFGAGLLMAGFLSAIALRKEQQVLSMAALVGMVAVEMTWNAQRQEDSPPGMALAWYAGIAMLFLVYPFALRKKCLELTMPWIAGACGTVPHFLMVYALVKKSWPNDFMGVVPAAFAVPTLAAVFVLRRWFPVMDKLQRDRLAWFGGVGLLFITLIFPIQFERQWITVSWAIEGALLLWLFRKVPHPGLQYTGAALLVTAFVRLSANPLVFTAYPRSGVAILNWYLYSYGLVAAAMFFAGHWFTDPENRWGKVQARPVFNAMGGFLLFLLLNIEVADYFTAPGSQFVAFDFSGNFPRDMTYSISWGLFSLGLLGMGFWKHSKHARYAAVGLLAVTLLKLFLHDLATIKSIYRIGALIGVAVIAFIASFLYQRFFDRSKGEAGS